MYDGWLRLGNTEIINEARTKAYAPRKVRCVSCADMESILGDEPYSNPTTDRAPWTIGNNSGAAFAGFVTKRITGVHNSSRELAIIEKVRNGGVPTRGRYASKVIGVTADAIAFSDAGMNAGLDWLNAALTGPCSEADCNGSRLEMLDSCPCLCGHHADTNAEPVTTTVGEDVPWEVDGTFDIFDGPEQQPVCGMVTVEWTVCSEEDEVEFIGLLQSGDEVSSSSVGSVSASGCATISVTVLMTPDFPMTWVPRLVADGPASVTVTTTVTHRPILSTEGAVAPFRRFFEGVVVVDGPKEVGDRQYSDNLVLSTIEWTMVATDPYMYRSEQILMSGEAEQVAPTFLATGVSETMGLQPEVSCPFPSSSSLLTCADDPSCGELVAPPAAPALTDCGPTVTEWSRHRLVVEDSVFGPSSATLTLSFTAGADPVVGRVRVWRYEDSPFECEFISETWIDYVPGQGILEIDASGNVIVTCLNSDPVAATRNVRGSYRGPYTPPEVGCGRKLVIALDAAAAGSGSLSGTEWELAVVRRVA